MTGKSASDRVVYSWDTNVFLAWLKHEPDKPLNDIQAVLDDIEKGVADLVVSTIVIAELLDLIDDEELARQFNQFLKRPNIALISVDPRVARRAARLRADWRRHRTRDSEERNIKTPDAIVIVTAMMQSVAVLHSTEPKMHRHSKTALVEELEIGMPCLSNGQRVLPMPIQEVLPSVDTSPVTESDGAPPQESETNPKPR